MVYQTNVTQLHCAVSGRDMTGKPVGLDLNTRAQVRSV